MHEAPESIEVLRTRARAMAGLTLAQLAGAMAVPIPPDLRRNKGWVGQLIERFLGAPGGGAAGPDFASLGVELKTLPVRPDGQPVESTWVCTLSIEDVDDVWESSRVRAKVAHVLWVPIEAGPPLAERHLGMPLLWRPDADEEMLIRRDWEEHMAIVRAGRIDTITAHHGLVLQVRPKAANARERGVGLDVDGLERWVLPRGFYLRSTFTAGILRRHFAL